MIRNQTLSRRSFFRRMTLMMLGSAAVVMSNSGCRRKLSSTPESYYTDRREEILKDNRKIFTAIRPLLVEITSEGEASVIEKATIERFDVLLPDLPYIGGSQNDLTANLINSAVGLAFYQEMKEHDIDLKETGRILFQAVTSVYGSDPMSGMMGRLANGTLSQEKLQKEAEASQKKLYPEDWVFEFVDGNEDFDFGINYIECGIHKYFQTQDAQEFTPYMCLLDVPISRAMNTGLVRTQTLARGGTCCDFRYCTGRNVQVEWDPGFVNGGK